MKKWQELNQKTKIMVASGVVLGALGLGGVVYGVTNYTQQQAYQAKVESVASSVDKETKTLKELQAKINQAYTDNKKTFLKATFTKQALKDLEKSIEDYQEKFAKLIKVYAELKESDTGDFAFKKANLESGQKALKVDFKALADKANKQFAVNDLFEKPYLVGNKTTDQPIKATVKKADVEKVKQSSYTKGATDKQPFEQALNKGIESAEAQVNQVEKATKAVSELYNKDKVTDKANKETLENAKKEVGAIKNTTIKKTFDKALKAIEDKVKADEKAKEEKAKTEAETKAKEVGGKVEKQADGSFVVKSSDGTEYKATGDGKIEIVTPKATQPAQSNNQAAPSNNGGGNPQAQPSQPSNNGGGTTQTQPNQPTQPSNNGGGNTQTEPTQPSKPATPTIVSGYIGNTGLLFNTAVEANTWADSKLDQEWLAGDFTHTRFVTIGVFYSDGTKKFSVDLL
ncbi:hypothetical protein CIRMBP1230_01431 [Enterococcus cecorum]|uniref:hypothetical protein n=1 Tax=Enterococcus cecorum TaxID=44008 RepID=UPI0022D98E92|nr:hypothetical protein [Enterococcus cecorum]CAI3252568.1 hypothetical protein CIRMBP1228_00031 [Enterococcus cecorum]CAI3253878.1 hypothetical protein CIRMBP1281_00047 [Enterococcus cecorum]CAI3309758.1 hypothetical protein CIRMBP1223_00789 [Enterococcus cecorum]CAI3309933.1 hypothetical protein CIRMBP1224_00748 [Enterococcus cecorum]CAI3314193.1 hypothetical protein CIRMBP1219_00804 [Enterococcus cecorum]